ncbi:MAG: DUF4287 domain-containing protein [Planctomycetes bacterium]|nr:DUF4287 domain-containing protein [Planctomycetota bacterium]
MPKSPREMFEAVMRNLEARTGKPVEAWVRLLKRSGLKERKERVAWLKERHGLGFVQAQVVADVADGKGSGYEDGEALMDRMFRGPKAALRPVYESLEKAARRLGADVTVYPCKTYVVFRRRVKFATVKPATASRVDLGLTLGKRPALGRLGKVRALRGDEQITHVVPLSTVAEVDREVLGWLREAYETV